MDNTTRKPLPVRSPSAGPPPLARITCQGTLLQVSLSLPHFRKEPPKKRKAVFGFSRPARLRMLKTIATIDWKNVGKSVMITLTYPDARGDRTHAERTRDRNVFLLALEREVGHTFPVLWRTEWKVRQSGERKGEIIPHMHLIALGVPYIDWRNLRKLWARTLEWDGYVATDIFATKNGNHAARYAAKYAAKSEVLDSLDYASYLRMDGRHWGLTRKGNVKWAREHHFEDAKREHVERAMEVASQLLGRHYVGSFFALTALATVFFKKIVGPIKWLLDYFEDGRYD